MSDELTSVTKSFGKELTQNLAIAIVASATIVLMNKLVIEISDSVSYRRNRRRIRKAATKA